MRSRDFWTPEKINKLREMRDAGHSAVIIGEALGVSRNAVLGKVFRLGLPRMKDAGAAGDRKPRAKPLRKPVARVKPVARPPVAYKPLRQPVEPPALVSLNIGILDLGPGMCRWIEGSHEHPAIYCGAGCDEGQSFCPGHRALVYRTFVGLTAAEQRTLWKRAA